MQIFTERQRALVLFLLSLLFVVTGFCHGGHRTVEVVGLGECADCKQNNILASQAFSGLRVTVECKSANGHFETRGAGELDEKGNFKVSLPHDFAKGDELKEECYAQLHSASAAPCPAHDGLEKSKIVIKSKTGSKHTLKPAAEKLKFSSAICISAFFWHSFKHPLFPKLHHPHPHLAFPPPLPIYKKPLAPPGPIYKKPLPPPVPIVKKPCPPKIKPSPPMVKKPSPPPTPIDKPLPPPVPIHEPPFFKPLPPFPELPPIFKKKPCPPLPKIPPKYFSHHPMFGNIFSSFIDYHCRTRWHLE